MDKRFTGYYISVDYLVKIFEIVNHEFFSYNYRHVYEAQLLISYILSGININGLIKKLTSYSESCVRGYLAEKIVYYLLKPHIKDLRLTGKTANSADLQSEYFIIEVKNKVEIKEHDYMQFSKDQFLNNKRLGILISIGDASIKDIIFIPENRRIIVDFRVLHNSARFVKIAKRYLYMKGVPKENCITYVKFLLMNTNLNKVDSLNSVINIITSIIGSQFDKIEELVTQLNNVKRLSSP